MYHMTGIPTVSLSHPSHITGLMYHIPGITLMMMMVMMMMVMMVMMVVVTSHGGDGKC
jgi:hypothetical protein